MTDTNPKPQKRGRLAALLKLRQPSQLGPSHPKASPDCLSLVAPQSLSLQPLARPVDAPPGNLVETSGGESVDRQRTKARYAAASDILEEAVKGRGKQWATFEIPKVAEDVENFNISQFKDNLNAVIERRRTLVDNVKGWGKCEHAIQCLFTAFSPFAKNVLKIAKESQSVLPLRNCSLNLYRYQ